METNNNEFKLGDRVRTTKDVSDRIPKGTEAIIVALHPRLNKVTLGFKDPNLGWDYDKSYLKIKIHGGSYWNIHQSKIEKCKPYENDIRNLS